MSAGRVLGIRIDLVENGRMREVLDRWGERFRDRVFLPSEQRYCEAKAFPCRHYAGRFAVKEAVTKAFGTGISPKIAWLDIEVVNDKLSGAPTVNLSPRAGMLVGEMSAGEVLVSLSHSHDYAIAQAILLGAEAGPTASDPSPPTSEET